jgi:hypothetical protein
LGQKKAQSKKFKTNSLQRGMRENNVETMRYIYIPKGKKTSMYIYRLFDLVDQKKQNRKINIFD